MKIPIQLRWSDLKVMTMTPPLRLPGWIDDPLRTHGVVLAAFTKPPLPRSTRSL